MRTTDSPRWRDALRLAAEANVEPRTALRFLEGRSGQRAIDDALTRGAKKLRLDRNTP
jgi:hypothetical protein